jgi:hypothetical protein
VTLVEGFSNKREAALWLDGSAPQERPPEPIQPQPQPDFQFLVPVPKRFWPQPGRPFEGIDKNSRKPMKPLVPVYVHRYTDRDGGVIGITCRYHREGKSSVGKDKKSFLPYRYVEDLGWVNLGFSLDGETPPIYNLHELFSKPNLPVLILEGEKKVDVAKVTPGFEGAVVPIAWMGGSGAVHKVDWSVLNGRDVIMWPDEDDSGKKVPAQILELCKPQRFRVLNDLKHYVDPTWDIVDEVKLYQDQGKSTVELAKFVFEHAEDAGDPPVTRRAGVAIRRSEWLPEGAVMRINSKGAPVANSQVNIALVLDYHPDFKGIFSYDTFDRQVMIWGEVVDKVTLIKLQRQLYASAQVEAPISLLEGWVGDYAQRNRVNRLFRDLKGLKWDGKHRLLPELLSDGSKGLLINYAGVRDDNAYTRMAGARWLFGLIRRLAREDGWQHDTALVLEGDQGFKKTTFFRELARILGRDLYTTLGGNVGKNEKDDLLKMTGKAIVELAEMTSHRTSEADAFKAFIDRISDHYRPPYGREAKEFPRHCVFGGTTNSLGQYLNDPTGNRRIWPVWVEEPIDADLIRRDVEQIWAEAMEFALKPGPYNGYEEPSWLTKEEAEIQSSMVEVRQEMDPWQEELEMLTSAEKPLHRDEIWKALMIPLPDQTRQAAKRVETIMTKLGWNYSRIGSGPRMWRKRQRHRLKS